MSAVLSPCERLVYEPVLEGRPFASFNKLSVLSSQFRLPGANDKCLLNSFLNVRDKLPVA
jgi:hypothetical protein